MDIPVEGPFFRSGYNYDRDAASFESGLECKDPSLTVQSDKDSADINVIVHRFGLTGTVPASLRLPEFADYSDIFDFQSAQNALIHARTTFMSIPAVIRSRFDNDPQKFLEFAGDPANIDELRKLGLAKAKPEPVVPAVVPPAPVPS